MVEIIGEDNSIKKRITCGNCASILEYTPNEIQEITTSDYLGDSDLIKFLNCPKCGKKVYV